MDNITDLLKANFNNDISGLVSINGGERSKAFVFESKGKKYIFRINQQDVGFKKDKYAYENYGKLLPIPEILQIGSFEDRFYAISDYCAGKPLDDDSTLSVGLTTDLILTLNTIQSISVPDGGFGVADMNGIANFKTWDDWVLKENTVVTKDDGSFFTWPDIKNISFVDSSIIDKLFLELKKVLPFVPNKRYLIHGDFATGNILVNNDEITGVIDWNESGYGDFLYDVAWFDFWVKKSNFTQNFKIQSQSINLEVADYDERIRCHQLFIGLTALGIYSAINLEENYFEVLKKVKSIIDL